jgi:hypothetical protein
MTGWAVGSCARRAMLPMPDCRRRSHRRKRGETIFAVGALHPAPIGARSLLGRASGSATVVHHCVDVASRHHRRASLRGGCRPGLCRAGAGGNLHPEEPAPWRGGTRRSARSSHGYADGIDREAPRHRIGHSASITRSSSITRTLRPRSSSKMVTRSCLHRGQGSHRTLEPRGSPVVSGPERGPG